MNHNPSRHRDPPERPSRSRRSRDIRRLLATLPALAALWVTGGVAMANTCTWKWSGLPAGSGLFSTSANWSGCGSTFPGSSDDVVFDKTTSNQSCTIDVAIDVNSITFQNAYTATVSPAGASTIRVRAGVTMPSGKLTFTSATTQIGGSFNQTGGTFSANGGTVIFNATGPMTQTFGGQPFNKVIINDGLVGYWNLDEGSGTSLADRSGYANNLQLNTASFTTAVPSLSFADPTAVAFTGSTFAQARRIAPDESSCGQRARNHQRMGKAGLDHRDAGHGGPRRWRVKRRQAWNQWRDPVSVDLGRDVARHVGTDTDGRELARRSRTVTTGPPTSSTWTERSPAPRRRRINPRRPPWRSSAPSTVLTR